MTPRPLLARAADLLRTPTPGQDLTRSFFPLHGERPVMLRAMARVVLRVLAKSAAYVAIWIGATWLHSHADGTGRTLLALSIVPWGAIALMVFAVKVREEAQRIRSNG